MTSKQELDRHAMALFQQVVDLSANERDARLVNQCGADVDLLARVKQLLNADLKTSDRLRTGHFLAESILRPHSQVGPYELGELIGKGGMGAVYRAERTDGAFNKTVAIKLLQTPSDGLLARFNVERQVMANLEHANIAQLLDGGSFEGQPFIVMEYIEGEPFVYRPEVPQVEVLRAFLQVCDAVDYAHNHLVLHRDIKPSNILLATDGNAKLLDFGVAKLLGERDAGDLTSAVGLPQTQAYTSPECLIGYPATVRTEVYSLGVLLREVTTGVRPQSFGGLSGQEAREEILQRYPKIQSVTEGDLNKIIAKAMDPEPKSRYPDVASLAADVNAFLSNRPITARSHNWSYLAWRFVQRHTAAVVVGTLSIASLVVALSISINEAANSKAQLLRANTIANFMNRIVNAPSNRYTGEFRVGPEATMREVLVVAGAELREDTAISAELKVELHSSISEALSLQLDDQGAVAEAREAWRIASSLPQSHNARFVALHTLASVLDIDGRPEALVEARPIIAQAVDWLSTNAPDDKLKMAQMFGELGYNHMRSGEHDEAIASYVEGLRLWRSGQGSEQHPIVGLVLGLIGHSHLALLQHDKAEKAFVEALSIIENIPGYPVAEWTKTYEGLTGVLLAKNRNAEAVNIFNRGLVMAERDSPRDPQTFRFVASTSIVLSQLGYTEQGAETLARITEFQGASALPSVRNVGTYAIAAAYTQFRLGNYAAAKEELSDWETFMPKVFERDQMFAFLLLAEIALVTKDNAEDYLSQAQALVTSLQFEESELAQRVVTLSRLSEQ